METPDTPKAAVARPFAEVLAEVNKGRVSDEAAAKLAELVAAVRATGRKGSIRLTLVISPFKGNDENLQVAGTVELRAPQAEAPASIFFLDDTGNLTRDDPNALFARNELTGANR